MSFVGQSLALSTTGFSNAMLALNTKTAEVWSVLSVETSGSGFLADRRPKILFERHVFSRLTDGQFDASHPDVSSPTPGGYGAGGSHQYDRLTEAISLNEDAALKSASWGVAQIMGNNFVSAGFASVQDMVQAMVSSEDAQMAAFSAFLLSKKLDRALAIHDWTTFAKGYNGPNFAENNYDGQLRDFFSKFSTGPLPDLDVRAAQVYLTFRHFDPRGIDGIMGPGTRSAIIQFQQSVQLPQTGLLDAVTLAQLTPS
jgi:hypothetical protein